jgi:general secretion pathway protein L
MDLNRAALANFLHWWLRQLSELLPPALSLAAKHRPDALIIDIESERVTLSLRREGRGAKLAAATADDAGIESLARKIHGITEPPHLLLFRVPRSMQLRKLSSFPLAARRDLDTVLSFEMDRETPFARGEVYWTHIIRRQDATLGRLDVELFIVPRAGVDPVIEAARRAGLHPSAIEIDVGAGADDVRLIRVGPARRWKWLSARRPLIAWSAAAAGLLLVMLVAPFIRQQIAIASADSAIDALTGEAREAAQLRQAADQAGRAMELFRKERERNGGILEVLAATTRLVPDDSHLTALSLRGGRLTITGQSPSAAHLVDLLAGSPAFREPTFDSPVVQDDSSGLETFTISASLSADGLARQIAAPVEAPVRLPGPEPVKSAAPQGIVAPRPDERKAPDQQKADDDSSSDAGADQ